MNPAAAVPENPPGGIAREAKTTRRRPAPERTGGSGSLPFKKLITGEYLRLIYILGAIVIILVSLLGISAGFSKPGSGAANESFINTTALAVNPTASPLFWIGVLIFGSLVWRIFCELAAVVFWLYDAVSSGGETDPGEETPEYFDDVAAGSDAEEDGEYVECPHCAKVVPPDQVRECEVCGVLGCSTCIRVTGLLRKKLTCRECFENK